VKTAVNILHRTFEFAAFGFAQNHVFFCFRAAFFASFFATCTLFDVSFEKVHFYTTFAQLERREHFGSIVHHVLVIFAKLGTILCVTSARVVVAIFAQTLRHFFMIFLLSLCRKQSFCFVFGWSKNTVIILSKYKIFLSFHCRTLFIQKN